MTLFGMLVFLIVFGLIWYLISTLPLPAQVKTVITVIMILVLIVIVLNMFGFGNFSIPIRR